MDPLIQGILLSLAPLSELRGGMIVAVAQGANPWLAWIFCTLANLFVSPIVFLFLSFLHSKLLWMPLYKRTFNYFLENARRKTHKYIERWGYIGLLVFVAIPLPFSGAYTGTLAAWFFGMKKPKAIAMISLGVVLASLLVFAMIMGWISVNNL